MSKYNTRILMISALAIAINVVVGGFVSYLKIPLLFLDSMGTIFIAARISLKYGMLVGLCTNLVLGLIDGASAIPFAVVSIATAIVVYIASRKGFGIITAIVTGLILAVLCAVLGTVVRLIFFGGFSGSGSDVLILALKASGETIFNATFTTAILANLVDKVVSCVLVSLLIMQMPKSINAQFDKII